MGEAFLYWVHLLAATTWVGSQVMLFAVVMPAARAIENAAVRSQLIGSVTRRFGYVGWGALLILLVTGIGNIAARAEDFDHQRYGIFDYDFRYAWLLTAKLALVVLIVVLTAWHTFRHGPRMLAMQQGTGSARPSAEAQERLRTMRRRSMLVSSVNLAFALALLYLVTLMQNLDFSASEV